MSFYRSRSGQYFIAIFWVLLTATASHLLTAYMGYRAVGCIFLLLIIILSFFLPFGPILTAAGLTAMIWDFYFIPPRGTLTIQAPEDILMLVAYFVIALASGFLGSQLAMTLTKKQYEEVARQALLLKESEKLHQTLLNCISHELRTPLTAIVGAATTLQSQSVKLKEEPLAIVLLDEIVSAGGRLNHVFENLLDMTRLESGMITPHKEWFDVAELVRFTLDRQKRFLLGHPVQMMIPEKSFYFFGDFNLLEHAFSNLLLNAAHYSPVELPIVLKVSKSVSEIFIHFMDHGAGIPADKTSELFKKFYRLPGSPAGGLGLGLSITKNLVELHGGRIHVANNAEGGTTFTVVLPSREPPREVRESESCI